MTHALTLGIEKDCALPWGRPSEGKVGGENQRRKSEKETGVTLDTVSCNKCLKGPVSVNGCVWRELVGHKRRHEYSRICKVSATELLIAEVNTVSLKRLVAGQDRVY